MHSQKKRVLLRGWIRSISDNDNWSGDGVRFGSVWLHVMQGRGGEEGATGGV